MKFYKPEEYQLKVEKLYHLVSNDLRKILPKARIEHIGSSSIPGSVSKGDLDIFVGVECDEIDNALSILQKHNYFLKEGSFECEHLKMLITDKYNHDVALQLVVNGSEYEFFIHFREILRSSPNLIGEYNALKISCAGMDENKYRKLKSDWIEKVLSNN